jgi:hypothetical protein
MFYDSVCNLQSTYHLADNSTTTDTGAESSLNNSGTLHDHSHYTSFVADEAFDKSHLPPHQELRVTQDSEKDKDGVSDQEELETEIIDRSFPFCDLTMDSINIEHPGKYLLIFKLDAHIFSHAYLQLGQIIRCYNSLHFW